MTHPAPGTPNPGLHYHYPITPAAEPQTRAADVVIYGGTSVGVAAAITAAQLGKTVELLVFGRHVGGMTTGGLGATDIGNKAAIGGLSRSFYRRLGTHYGRDESWTFEPHVAEDTMLAMLAEAGVTPRYEQRLAAVQMDGRRVVSLTTEDGQTYAGKAFIDASYEGDLLAMAGVSFAVGREPNRQYRETLNGVHFGHPGHNFDVWVDPYVVEGDPGSGLLYGFQGEEPGFNGQGDGRVQAYNFRVCLTDDPRNKRSFDGLPFPQPPGYDAARHELLLRTILAGQWSALKLTTRMPHGKTDTNNHGPVSSDHIGFNVDWPEGDYATREAIFAEHVAWNQGMYYFLVTDGRVPPAVRDEVMRWGLPRDEFAETDGWPHELYVREARRMVSDLVITEHHCTGAEVCHEPIGMAAYQMDSHNTRRLVLDGRAVNEGNVEVKPRAPYPIGYRALVPKRGECENLVVPWCVSASHIAFGSIRMEPVGMILGESASVIASMALDANVSVQDLDYPALRDALTARGQVLATDAKNVGRMNPTGDD